MKLEVHERLAILELLPLESDYSGWLEIRVAKETLELTPEEKLYINFREEINQGVRQILWDTQKSLDVGRDIPVSNYITGIIREKLAELSKKKKMQEKYFSVFEKFVAMYK
jgi:hypothetical protein